MIFIDSDILLDIAWKREPFYRAAASVLALAFEQKIEVATTPVVLSNIYYLLRSSDPDSIAVGYLQRILKIVKYLPLDQSHFSDALSSDFKDKEDAFNYYAAVSAGCKIILTRNVKDFRHSQIEVMTAEEFMAQW